MTLLLYAVTGRPASPGIAVAGVDGKRVQAIASSGLTALVSRHDAAPELDERAAWAFERVVESAMADSAVLPARFGSTLADTTAAEQLLRDRRGELTDKLDRVRGRVELSLRAIWADDHGAGIDTASGTEYMRTRLAPVQSARALSDHIRTELTPLAAASRYRLLARPSVPVTAAFLIDRRHVEEFTLRAAQLDRRLPDVDLVCTGPWPPYSFVGADGDD